MSTAEPDVEEQVRKLAQVGLSTRHIARVIGDVSQSTVVRTIARINSGPQPILRDGDTLAKREARRLRVTIEVVRTGALIALVVVLAVLTAAVATIAWR